MSTHLEPTLERAALRIELEAAQLRAELLDFMLHVNCHPKFVGNKWGVTGSLLDLIAFSHEHGPWDTPEQALSACRDWFVEKWGWANRPEPGQQYAEAKAELRQAQAEAAELRDGFTLLVEAGNDVFGWQEKDDAQEAEAYLYDVLDNSESLLKTRNAGNAFLAEREELRKALAWFAGRLEGYCQFVVTIGSMESDPRELARWQKQHDEVHAEDYQQIAAAKKLLGGKP